MRLLAEGVSVSETARRVGVVRTTVQRWRDTPAGAETLATATASVEQKFASALEETRAELLGALPEMGRKLVTIAREGDPSDALRAIGMAMDRVGLPRTQRIETPAIPMDTSTLSAEELDQLDALLARIGGR